MPDDLFDEFLGYDFAMGADMVKYPHCGTDVPCGLFFDDEVECPKCGKCLLAGCRICCRR